MTDLVPDVLRHRLVLSYEALAESVSADQLIGRGDMLLSTGNDLIRIQCAFVDTPEVDNITDSGNALYGTLKSSLEQAIPNELRAPLPEALQDAQMASMIQYLLDIGQGSQLFLPQISNME